MMSQGEGEASKLKPRQVSWGPRKSRNVPRDQWGLFKGLEWQSREPEGTLKTKCAHLTVVPGTSPMGRAGEALCRPFGVPGVLRSLQSLGTTCNHIRASVSGWLPMP